MKRIIKSISLLCIAGALFTTSCKKKEEIIDETSTTVTNNNSNGQVKTTVAGSVVDEANNPVQGAMVSLSGTTTTTDQNGLFLFENINANSQRAYVKVTASGYFSGSRMLKPTENNVSKAKVILQQKSVTGTINATTGGTVSLTNGSSIELPVNGVVVESSGQAYTGTVNVYAKYLDPSTNEIAFVAPGDMQAIDENGDSKLLGSLGMMNVELEGAGGEKLQIASGSTSNIKIATPFSSGNPSTIPLWYFDNNQGIWIEEGEAILNGNVYEGSVSHYTIWNVDMPCSTIDVCGQIVDPNGNPMQGVAVSFRSMAGWYHGTVYTDANGNYCGEICEGSQVEIEVFGDDCFGQILTSTVQGPFTANTTIPAIAITQGTTTLVEGLIQLCDPNQVFSGYIYLDNNGVSEHIYVQNNSFQIQVCDANLMNGGITIGDSTFTYILNQGQVNNIGVLNICSVVEQGVTVIGNINTCTNDSVVLYIDHLGYPNATISSNGNDFIVSGVVNLDEYFWIDAGTYVNSFFSGGYEVDLTQYQYGDTIDIGTIDMCYSNNTSMNIDTNNLNSLNGLYVKYISKNNPSDTIEVFGSLSDAYLAQTPNGITSLKNNNTTSEENRIQFFAQTTGVYDPTFNNNVDNVLVNLSDVFDGITLSYDLTGSTTYFNVKTIDQIGGKIEGVFYGDMLINVVDYDRPQEIEVILGAYSATRAQ